jgi:N-acetylneuraminate synthase
MDVKDANLATISALKKKFKCQVGYSGHEVGLPVSYAAAALGITSLERHITLDRTMYGSDQSASIEKKGMTELVRNIRTIELAIGKNKMGYIFPKEIEISKKLRAHIKGYKS